MTTSDTIDIGLGKAPDPDPAALEANLTKRTKRAFLWSASTSLVWQLLTWVITFWTVRILHPEDYGIVALAETVTPYVALIASLNLSTWIIQESTLKAEDERSIFTLSTLLGATMACFLYGLAPFVSSFYETPELSHGLRLLTAGVFLRGLSTLPDSILRRDLRFREVGILQIIVGIFRSFTQLYLAYNGWGWLALIYGVLIKECGESLGAIYLQGIPLRFGLSKKTLHAALSFGVPLTLATLLWMAYSSADVIIIGKLFGPESLGFYALALTLVNLPMTKVSQMMRPVLLPYFSRLKDITESLGPAFLKINRLVSAIIIPTLTGLACTASEAIPIILGDKWEASIHMVQVLAIVGILKSIVDTVPVVMTAKGKASQSLFLNVIATVTVPVGLLIGGSLYGITGIFIAWFVAQSILSVSNFWVLKPLVNVSVYQQFYNLSHPALASLFMAGMVLCARNLFHSFTPRGITLSVEITIGILSYMLFYWIIFKKEARELLGFIKGLR